MQNNYLKLALLTSSFLFVNSPKADTAPPQPPQEAIAACSSLSEGSQCSFTHPQGTLEGLCLDIVPELACAPEGALGLKNDHPENSVAPGNIIAHYNADNATLVLPIVSIADTLYYQVRLQLVSNDPILLNLSDAIEIKKSEQVSATYDESTSILSVPQMVFDTQHYSLSLKLVRSKPEFQFELISITEFTPHQAE